MAKTLVQANSIRNDHVSLVSEIRTVQQKSPCCFRLLADGLTVWDYKPFVPGHKQASHGKDEICQQEAIDLAPC